MKTIKVFLASSEELRMERLIFADLEMMLNNRLLKRGIKLVFEMWEHLDASMGIKHKQDEYNDILKTCDICIVVFWEKFGEYTKKEFDVAYSEMTAGRNPNKVYVYFKNNDSSEKELKIFKDDFTRNYGDISYSFGNKDTMRYLFILQLEQYCTDFQTIPLYVIEGDGLFIDGVQMVDLSNVPKNINL